MRTAVWMVMWSDPVILAPLKVAELPPEQIVQEGGEWWERGGKRGKGYESDFILLLHYNINLV